MPEEFEDLLGPEKKEETMPVSFDEIDEMLKQEEARLTTYLKPGKHPTIKDNPNLLGRPKKMQVPGTSPMEMPKPNQPMIAFRTKAGELIYGPGDLYYVVRYKGKLHYKQEQSVTRLPDDWEEGDPIPGWAPGEELL